MKQPRLLYLLILLSVTTLLVQSFGTISFGNGKILPSNPRTLDASPSILLPTINSTSNTGFLVSPNITETGLSLPIGHTESNWQILIYANRSVALSDICDTGYLCYQPSCLVDPVAFRSVKYPFFAYTNMYMINFTTSNLTIADGAWSTSSLLYATSSCSATSYSWIGLGLSAGGSSNFRDSSNPVFSFLFYQDPVTRESTDGQLIFGYNDTYVDHTKPPISLITDQDWSILVSGIAFEGKDFLNFSNEIPLIFDVQSQGIMLPDPLCTELLFQFDLEECNTKTQDDGSQSPCFFMESELGSLPNMNILLANGSTFSLPASAYMNKLLNGSSSIYIFNIELFVSHTTGPYVILGVDFMDSFYTVFNQSGETNTVTMYPLSPDLIPQSNPVNNTSNTATDPPTDTPSSTTTDPLVDNTTDEIPAPSTTTDPTTNTTTDTPADSTGNTSTNTPANTTVDPPADIITDNTPISSSTTDSPTDSASNTPTTPISDDGESKNDYNNSVSTTSGGSDAGTIVAVIIVIGAIVGIFFFGRHKGWWCQPKNAAEEVELMRGRLGTFGNGEAVHTIDIGNLNVLY